MKIQILKDILKSKVDGGMKYSQGRVYLFVFVISYIASLCYYMFIPNITSMQTIIDGLQWAILLFAAYVFGTNGVTVTKDILKKSSNMVIPAPAPTPSPIETTPDKTNTSKEEDMCT